MLFSLVDNSAGLGGGSTGCALFARRRFFLDMVGYGPESHLRVIMLHLRVVVANRSFGCQESRVVQLHRNSLVWLLIEWNGTAGHVLEASITVAAEDLARGEG